MTTLTLLTADYVETGVGVVVTIAVTVDDDTRPAFRVVGARPIAALESPSGTWTATWVTEAEGDYVVKITAGDADPLEVDISAIDGGDPPPDPDELDLDVASLIASGSSSTKAGLAAFVAPQLTLATRNLGMLREAARAGRINAAAQLLATGDSHTDIVTAAQYFWQQLWTYRNQPGEGLEGILQAAFLIKGKNGSTLRAYLDSHAQAGGLDEGLAANPFAGIHCWLVNDVRLGGLGLTVAAIRAAGKALLDELLAYIYASGHRPRFNIFRVPAPFTTVDGGEHYVRESPTGTINPAGLAQIYTDGLRAAYYDFAEAHPEVLLYDPQTRLFGTICPTANGGYFNDQIHQNQNGYWAEADDFAAWLAAALPRVAARATEARRTTPLTPWTAYYAEVEDGSRYVQIGEGIVTTDRPDTSTFIDIGPSFPGLSPGSILAGDLIEIIGARTTIQIPSGSTMTAQGANTRIVLGSGTVGVAVAYQHKVKVWRRKVSPTDAAFNTILEDPSYLTKLVGRVQGAGNSGATFITIEATTLSAAPTVGLAKEWVRRISPGDKLYVEGLGTAVVRTLGAGDYVQQGNSVRILNVADTGHNYSGDNGLLAVIVGTHPDRGYGDLVNTVAAAGAAQTIPDPAAGTTLNVMTLSAATCALTFPAAIANRRFELVLVQDATGSRAVTWPGTVKWAAGTTPTLTTTGAKRDWFRFTYDGTSWLGELVGQNY